MRKKNNRSLGFEIGSTVALAFVVGVLCYFLVSSVGRVAVERVYMSVTANEERLEKIYKEFTAFSKAGEKSRDPIGDMQKWLRNKHGFKIYAFDLATDKLIFESDGYLTTTYTLSDSNAFLNIDSEYMTVRYANKSYKIIIKDNTYMKYFDYVDFSALIISCFVAMIIIFTEFGKIIKRIIKLSRQVKVVTYGDMDRVVSVNGTDEISELGNDIDTMRRTIIQHYQNEQDAIKANNDLLTSISHDIRTPLTSVIGYSEVMADESLTDVDEMKKYASICRDKAYRLKELTDTMFRYFYVYGKDNTDFAISKYDAKQLLDQLLGEYIVELMQEGFNVEVSQAIEQNLQMSIDADMFKRVIDNVFSNFKRYADNAKTIFINVYVEDDYIVVECENSAKSKTQNIESTKIGLKTCSRIMSQMNGRFEITTNGKSFKEKIYIPIG